MKKALVLYSGGLDSKLTVFLMRNKGYDVEALHFKLPFGGSRRIRYDAVKFPRFDIKLTVLDVTRGRLLEEYLEVLKDPKYPRGKGVNPCVDCKIFLFRKAKEYADKHDIKVIASGEVVGQRPLSQTIKKMQYIDSEIEFTMYRPLDELGIRGRQRVKQMELAEEFGIDYPTPGPGCLLCDIELRDRLALLLKKKLISEKTLPLATTGKHFYIENIWYVVGRNKEENKVLEQYKNTIISGKGKPAVYYHEKRKSALEQAYLLQNAYSKKGDRQQRRNFEKIRL